MTAPSSVPSDAAPQKPAAASRARSRLVLLALCAIFVAPVAISLLLQTPMFHYNAQATKNFGSMISPVQPIPLWDARQPGIQNNAQATWTMLYVPGANDAVEQQTKLLQTIRLAQGRHIDRVRLEIVEGSAQPLSLGADWRVSSLDGAQLQALRTQLGLGADGGVVILDPFRNAMLRHAGAFDGSHLRKDLARILRISQAGKKQSEGLIG
jgi:hypothetical protein